MKIADKMDSPDLLRQDDGSASTSASTAGRKNWEYEETKELLNQAIIYKDVIVGTYKGPGGATYRNECWQKVLDAVNAVSRVKRDRNSCTSKLKCFKCSVKHGRVKDEVPEGGQSELIDLCRIFMGKDRKSGYPRAAVSTHSSDSEDEIVNNSSRLSRRQNTLEVILDTVTEIKEELCGIRTALVQASLNYTTGRRGVTLVDTKSGSDEPMQDQYTCEELAMVEKAALEQLKSVFMSYIPIYTEDNWCALYTKAWKISSSKQVTEEQEQFSRIVDRCGEDGEPQLVRFFCENGPSITRCAPYGVSQQALALLTDELVKAGALQGLQPEPSNQNASQPSTSQQCSFLPFSIKKEKRPYPDSEEMSDETDATVCPKAPKASRLQSGTAKEPYTKHTIKSEEPYFF